MPYAHKLTTFESDYRIKTVYCSVCGQENDLAGPCPGDGINEALEKGFKEIFGSRTEYGSKYLKEVLDSQRKGI